jgi:antitoxin Phd
MEKQKKPGKKEHFRSSHSAPAAHDWQLQEAKARFSEVVRRALADGPQTVTKQGKDAVVVVAADEFQRLKRRSKQPESLVEFFAKSPLAGVDLDLERDEDLGRDIEL